MNSVFSSCISLVFFFFFFFFFLYNQQNRESVLPAGIALSAGQTARTDNLGVPNAQPGHTRDFVAGPVSANLSVE